MLAGSTAPSTIGRYRILGPVGQGGVAMVYRARLAGIGGFERDVALKLLHPHLQGDPAVVHDLLNEARIAAGLRHPHVVPVLDVGETAGTAYLVMDYIDGRSLADLARAKATGEAMPLRVALRILCDLLSGLHAAHELRDERGELQNLVHRDITPQNVLVGLDGLTRISDFGIAKAASRSGVTATGLVRGKVAYMSPEQARGLTLDRRSDVWAAGVVAWELLAGRRLFEGREDAAILLRLLTERPGALSKHRPEAGHELDSVVRRALSRDPLERWPTAMDFRDALMVWARSANALADHAEVSDFMRTLAPIAQASAPQSGPSPSVSSIEGTATPLTERTPTARSTRRLWLFVAGAFFLILAGGVGIAFQRGAFALAFQPSVAVMSSPAGSAAPAVSSLSPASAASPTEARSPSTSSPEGPSAEPQPARALRVLAERPLVQIVVVDHFTRRVIPFDPPSRDVSIDVASADPSSLRIEGITLGGHRITVAVPADAQRVELRDAQRRAPPPKSTMPTSLEPSPYGRP